MPPLTPDAAAELHRAIHLHFAPSDCRVAFEELTSRSWASVTFTGARHRLRFRLEGQGAAEAADRFLAQLHEANFELRGHVLADIALLAEERLDEGALVRISLEALTVEEG